MESEPMPRILGLDLFEKSNKMKVEKNYLDFNTYGEITKKRKQELPLTTDPRENYLQQKIKELERRIENLETYVHAQMQIMKFT